MRFRTLHLPAALACILFSASAHAGPCDAHFTFDGNLSDASGNGYDGRLIGKGGGAASGAASYGEGRNGQALLLSGAYAVRAPVDLSKEVCPQVTVIAWVRLDDDPTKGTQDIFSSGRGGPRFNRVGTHLEVRSGDQRQQVSNGLRGGRWEFIAAAIDQEAGKMTVYWRQRTFERDMKPVGTNSPDIWIGAIDDDLRNPVLAGAIDELRIFGQVLTADQVKQIQVGTPRQPGSMGLPGDQYDPAQLPGDQYDPRALPGDQYDPAQLPGDQYDPRALPGDQYEPEADAPPPTTGQNNTGEFPASVMPAGLNSMTTNTTEVLQQARDENAPPDITYDSEEEGEAAAAAAAERRAQGAADAESSSATATRSQALEESGTYPMGEPRESSLAGIEGNIRRRVDLVDNFAHKITWKQGNQKPCQIMVGGRNNSHSSVEFECPVIGPVHRLPSGGSYEILDREVALRVQYAAIGRIMVCNRDSNDRLKGIQIWGDQINADGTTTYREETDSEEFPNCNGNWSSSVLCPSGTLATGLVVHANDRGGNNKAEIVGLRLICRSIGVR